jgi:hypothetical protein
MQTQMISEFWGELKRYINTVDRSEAAESMIAIMIDHDCDPEDIRTAFSSDSEFKRILADYLDQENSEEEYSEEEDEHDIDDENWED